jgi:hypothetical protein
MTPSRMTLPLALLSIAALIGCASPPAAPSAVASAASPLASSTAAPTSTVQSAGGRHTATGVIYVTDQGLYYDTFVAKDPLPMKGPFQPLTMGPHGAETPYGPGDPGYLGGRWWMDTNGNHVQDEEDHFFLCPLLGPGRPTP